LFAVVQVKAPLDKSTFNLAPQNKCAGKKWMIIQKKGPSQVGNFDGL